METRCSAGNRTIGVGTDGNNFADRSQHNVRSCASSYTMANFNVVTNHLLFRPVRNLAEFPDRERADRPWSDDDQSVASGRSDPRSPHLHGPTLHWCGPNQLMAGVHVENNAFNCRQFSSCSNGNYTMKLDCVITDGSTTCSGMHTCAYLYFVRFQTS